MNNTIQAGDVLTVTAPQGGATAGVPFRIGLAFLVPVTDAAEGADVACETEGVFSLPKAAVELAQGAEVFWDSVAGNCTNVATANLSIGYATALATAGTATVNVALTGQGVPMALTFGTGAGTACEGNDSRLSDARTPTAHAASHGAGGADALPADAVAGTAALRTLGTGAQQACGGADARLTDARTPTAHAATHNAGGADALAIDAVAGTGSLRTLGTGAQQACGGADARLTDARAPTAHAAAHLTGGADAVQAATAAQPGLMTAAYAAKVDGIAAGASVHYPGTRAVNLFSMPDAVTDTNTATIGADVYEFVNVNTNSGVLTTGNDFNNVTDPLPDATFAGHGRIVGDLIGIGTEIMRVSVVQDEDTLTLQRGWSGTVAAVHADGVAIMTAAANIGAVGRIAVGTLNDLAAATMSDRWVATMTMAIAAGLAVEPVTFADIDANTLLLTADDVGVAGNAIATTETMTSANNVWANATMYGGADRAGGAPTGAISIVFDSRVPNAVEVTRAFMAFAFGSVPTPLLQHCHVTATPFLSKDITDTSAVVGTTYRITQAGATHFAATDTVSICVLCA